MVILLSHKRICRGWWARCGRAGAVSTVGIGREVREGKVKYNVVSMSGFYVY